MIETNISGDPAVSIFWVEDEDHRSLRNSDTIILHGVTSQKTVILRI
jgi:hypothetical protein